MGAFAMDMEIYCYIPLAVECMRQMAQSFLELIP